MTGSSPGPSFSGESRSSLWITVDRFITRTWYSIAYFQICGILERSKYYAIWSLTEVRIFLEFDTKLSNSL